MRHPYVSYLSRSVSKNQYISANQPSSLQLSLQGQKVPHNLERVEEQRTKQYLEGETKH